MLLWRDLKLPISPTANLFEDHILNKMSSVKADIADKTEDHIELSHQIGKCYERRYKGVTDFAQSKTSQTKLQDILSNPIIEMKSDQIKIQTSRKFKKRIEKYINM